MAAASRPEPSRPFAFGAAIQGQRDEQQDSFRIRRLDGAGEWLLVLADGMGGHASGAAASQIAVDAFVATCVSRLAAGASLDSAFAETLEDVNARIARFQEQNPRSEGMGATLVAAHLSPAGVAWISVGDSPLWLYGVGGLRRLNADHSMRGVAGASGSFANMLQSAVNGQPIPLIDCHPLPEPLGPDDCIVLASDGLFSLSEAEIAATMANCGGDPKACVERLLAEVEKRDMRRQDNCSVIVARAEPPGRQTPVGLIAGVAAALAAAVVAYLFLMS